MSTVFRLSLVCALVAACPGNEPTETTADDSTGQNQTTSGTTGGEPTTGGDMTTGGTTGGPTTDDTTGSPTTDATTGGPTTDNTTGDGTTTDNTTGDGTTGDGTTGGAALSWEKDVFPIVVQGTCGCHGGGSGGLTMTGAADSYANIVDVDATQVGFKRVAPGDPANSYFLAKVKGTAGGAPFNSGSPSQMPKGGAPLSMAAIDTLEQWIAEGANP